MQGLAAITAQNGWAMALAGACIVMSGLAVLSFIISQLHRVVRLFEKPEIPPVPEPESEPEPESAKMEGLYDDLPAAARIYSPLSAELGETFELVRLYQVFSKENVPHPHITIRAFREAGILVPTGDGTFSWKDL